MYRETFRPQLEADRYSWDSWFVHDAGSWHVFYLQADRQLHPDARHDHATVGHAVSKDLLNWEEQGTILRPGDAGAWDDLAIWTGSIIKSNETDDWHFFYTGRGHTKRAAQLIGHAVSNDLFIWQKTTVANPLVVPGGSYDTSDTPRDSGEFPAWRDPYLYFNDAKQRYEMLVTARRRELTPYNACIARLVSKDLQHWDYLEPVIAGDRYDQMEVPQLVRHNNDGQMENYIFFSNSDKDFSPAWQSEVGGSWYGLQAFWAQSLEDEFRPVNGNGNVLANGNNLYDVRILDQVPGTNRYRAIGFLNHSEESGEFIGALSEPFLLEINNGTINLVS